MTLVKQLQRSLLVEMFQGKDWPILFYRNLLRFKGTLMQIWIFLIEKDVCKETYYSQEGKNKPLSTKLLIENYHASFSEKIRMRYSL